MIVIIIILMQWEYAYKIKSMVIWVFNVILEYRQINDSSRVGKSIHTENP